MLSSTLEDREKEVRRLTLEQNELQKKTLMQKLRKGVSSAFGYGRRTGAEESSGRRTDRRTDRATDQFATFTGRMMRRVSSVLSGGSSGGGTGGSRGSSGGLPGAAAASEVEVSVVASSTLADVSEEPSCKPPAAAELSSASEIMGEASS